MNQPELLNNTQKSSLSWSSGKKEKIWKKLLSAKRACFVLAPIALMLIVSGCAGTGKLEVGGSKIDYSKLDVYGGTIDKRIKKESRNYETGKLYKTFVGKPMVSKIKGHVKICKALDQTNAGQYITQKGEEYEIKYEDASSDGLYVHVGCQGNYSDCGVGYYKIDEKGNLLSSHPYYDYYGEWYVVDSLSIKNDSNQTIEKGTKIFEPLVSIAYSEDAYKSELIYSGVNDNTLKLEYKKYLSYQTKPSSQQRLSYTVTKSDNIIAFQNYRIKIVQATNQYVKYIVLSD